MNQKVAVLMGGASAEREVSLLSGAGVLQALRSKGVNAHAFDPSQRDMCELKSEGFTHCFIALHGRWGEDGTVQGAFELMGIPYTGSGVLASAIATDKVMTKRVWRSEGIPTPRYQVWHQNTPLPTPEKLAELGLPLIVKPAREGSSLGVTKVSDPAGIQQAIDTAAELDSDVLFEEYIQGDEVTCPILGSAEDAHALPLIRIRAPGGTYDYQHKYFTDDTRYDCPCGLAPEHEAELRALVMKSAQVLGCRGWGRADLILSAQGRPYLLEMNTSPGMTSHSLVPMSARVAGLEFEALCLKILEGARLG